MAQLGTAYIKIAPDLTGIQGTIAKSIGAAGKKSSQALGSSISANLTGIGKSVAGLGLKIGAGFATAIGGAVGFAVKGASELEVLRASFNSLTGDVKTGTKIYKTISDYAVASPFSVKGLSSATQTMLAFGVETGKVEGILKRLGDISLGNEERLGSLALAFAQTTAAGRLTGQDLLQMVNAGFNPLQVMSEKTGKSIAVLRDEMSAGKISVAAVEQAFIAATSEGGKFYGAVEQGNKSLAGRFNSLKESIALVAFELVGLDDEGNIIQGSFFEKLSQGLATLTGFLDENKQTIIDFGQRFLDFAQKQGAKFLQTIKNIGNFLVEHKEVVLGVVGALTLLIGGFVVVSSIAAAVGFVIANIGTIITVLVVGAIGALVGWLWTMRDTITKSFDTFKKKVIEVKEIWGGMKAWFKGVWDSIVGTVSPVIDSVVDKFRKGLDKVKEIWGGIKAWFKGVWDSIVESAKAFATPIGKAIEGAFKWALNGAIGAVEWAANKLIDGVNWIGGVLNEIPGVKVSKLNSIAIPRLAEGGIVTSPTLALIGEGRESEAVIPLSKLDEVAGSGGKGKSITINNNNTFVRDSDPDAFSRKLAFDLGFI